MRKCPKLHLNLLCSDVVFLFLLDVQQVSI